MAPRSVIMLLCIFLVKNISSSAQIVGAWSMAVTLWQQFEYYYYYYIVLYRLIQYIICACVHTMYVNTQLPPTHVVVFSKMAQSDILPPVVPVGSHDVPEPTPVPVKRGRGRPPKNKDAASRAPRAQPSDQLKRGRGRPRKNPDASPQPKIDPNASKRPPGRPRKDLSKPVEPNAPKRARGPKKDSAQEALAPDDHDTASSTEPSAQPSEDGLKKKRNPGRPKKVDSGARKVGRPRKRPLEVAAGEEDAKVGGAAPEDAPVKKQKGRPPNGGLGEKPREHRESSETSYSTPEPEVEP